MLTQEQRERLSVLQPDWFTIILSPLRAQEDPRPLLEEQLHLELYM